MDWTHGDLPKKIQIIRDGLEYRFYDVRVGGDFRTMFVFNNGRQSWQLRFNRDFLDDIYPIEKLQPFLSNTIIPELLANPDMRIEIGRYGKIAVIEKQS